jgi:hypothetical protein
LRPTAFDRESFARRSEVVVFGERAWISSAEDVIVHKLLWNQSSPSDRQLLDAAGVAAVQQQNLDLPYLRRWATELGIQDTLEKLLSGKIQPKQT